LHSNDPAFKKVYRWQGYSLYPNVKTKEEAIAFAEFLIRTKSITVPKFRTFWIEREIVKTTVMREKVTKVLS
jgi:hypothetical protein